MRLRNLIWMDINAFILGRTPENILTELPPLKVYRYPLNEKKKKKKKTKQNDTLYLTKVKKASEENEMCKLFKRPCFS